MFRSTDPQTSLLESYHLLPPAKRARLDKSWALPFREKVLPLIDEEVFRDAFAADGVGRPNRSIRLLTAVHLLKEWYDLTDTQALEQLEYNLQWHYALGLEAQQAHLCQKTLHNYRMKLMASGRAQKMFETVTRGLAAQDGLAFGQQRLDSTHVISNIAALTRLGLFVETVTQFVRRLRADAVVKLSALDGGYKARYLDRQGYFGDVKKEQARRRLPVVARDIYSLVTAFKDDSVVKDWESFQLLVRLMNEQIDIAEPSDSSEGSVVVAPREAKEISSTSLQSPHDPDASYGRKGKGFQLQVSETCEESNVYQVVTGVALEGAHESDQHAVGPMLEQLACAEMKPEILFADTGYGSGANIVSCREQGVDLKAPVRDPGAPEKVDYWQEAVEPSKSQAVPVEAPTVEEVSTTSPPSAPADTTATVELESAPLAQIGLDDFNFDETFSSVLSCPAGTSPSKQAAAAKGRKQATFSVDSCQGCLLARRCPAKKLQSGNRRLRWHPPKAATAARQREQQTAAFKERYKIRSGVESTMGELKHCHGAAGLRVRGRKRVNIVLHFKVLAMNIKRALGYHVTMLSKTLQAPLGELTQAT